MKQSPLLRPRVLAVGLLASLLAACDPQPPPAKPPVHLVCDAHGDRPQQSEREGAFQHISLALTARRRAAEAQLRPLCLRIFDGKPLVHVQTSDAPQGWPALWAQASSGGFSPAAAMAPVEPQFQPTELPVEDLCRAAAAKLKRRPRPWPTPTRSAITLPKDRFDWQSASQCQRRCQTTAPSPCNGDETVKTCCTVQGAPVACETHIRPQVTDSATCQNLCTGLAAWPPWPAKPTSPPLRPELAKVFGPRIVLERARWLVRPAEEGTHHRLGLLLRSQDPSVAPCEGYWQSKAQREWLRLLHLGETVDELLGFVPAPPAEPRGGLKKAASLL